MIAKKHYAGYITVLATIGFISCGTAPNASEGQNAASAPNATTAQQSEAEVPANSVLWIELQKDLDSSKLKTGDHFTGTIAEDVLVNGKPAIPKGAGVKGRVTNSATAQSQGSAGLLSLVLDSVSVRGSTYNVRTNPVTLQAPPLEQNLPDDKYNKAAQAAGSAYVPKKGTLQFFLASAVRVK